MDRQTLIPRLTLRDGRTVPAIGFGTFASDNHSAETVAAAVEGGIRAGYRFIDCASVYGNEPEIGEVLWKLMAEGIVSRGELFIASKVWNDHHGPGDVLVSCAQTLHDLRVDQLDMYFVHWPFPNYHAPGCDGDSRQPDAKPFDVNRFMATWRQMERLCDMGLVRGIGMSNMTIPKLEAVLPLCRIQPQMIEMELHPAFQQPELFDYCVRAGIQPIGFCPMGSPNRPERDRTAEDIAATQMPVIRDIAQAHGIHPTMVCLKWAVQRGQIPIPFSVNPAHYTDNLKAVTTDPLSDEEMAAIAQADARCRLIKGQVFLWPGADNWELLWDPDGVICQ